jgi:hypothetical protein
MALWFGLNCLVSDWLHRLKRTPHQSSMLTYC